MQAILDWVHNHIRFDYTLADATRTAHAAYIGQVGVCRDYTHLAIAFCRCMNIPARYCTGYLGDIGNVPAPGPMDFSAWLQVYLGGHWYTVDARNNTARIGRILMALGRDATDVALSTQFGPASLVGFEVVTEEVMSWHLHNLPRSSRTFQGKPDAEQTPEGQRHRRRRILRTKAKRFGGHLRLCCCRASAWLRPSSWAHSSIPISPRTRSRCWASRRSPSWLA